MSRKLLIGAAGAATVLTQSRSGIPPGTSRHLESQLGAEVTEAVVASKIPSYDQPLQSSEAEPAAASAEAEPAAASAEAWRPSARRIVNLPTSAVAADVDSKFGSAFLNSLGMIFATEIGDKTFFIAAIMAMQNGRLAVFAGAIGALVVMTILSTIVGHALPHLLPKLLTHWASILLFLYFGMKMLLEAKNMYATGKGAGVSDELEEVEHELVGKGLAINQAGNGAVSIPGNRSFTELGHMSDMEFGLDATEGGNGDAVAGNEAARKMTGREVVLQAFILTFVAEWGDRSQIATIALAAAQNPYAVTLGAVMGHSVCTGMAVVGGKLLATRITERQVALSGGILFLLFAFYSWFVGL